MGISCFSIAHVRYIKILTSWTPRLCGQTSIFGLVLFVCKSLVEIKRQRNLEKIAILTIKPRSHVRILIYRTWAIVSNNDVLNFHHFRMVEVYSLKKTTLHDLDASSLVMNIITMMHVSTSPVPICHAQIRKICFKKGIDKTQ